MKKILLVLPFLLTACFGGGSSTECVNDFWNGSVGTCLPDEWEIMSREELDARGVPSDVVVAFRKKVSIAGQYPAAMITKEELMQAADSTSYSEASMRAVEVLPGYTLLDSQEIEMGEDTLLLHTYNVQPVSSEPAKRFYQLSAISGDAGYTISASAPLSVEKDIQQEMVTIVENLTFEEK